MRLRLERRGSGPDVVNGDTEGTKAGEGFGVGIGVPTMEFLDQWEGLCEVGAWLPAVV